jgi:DNA repair exonuclease SbcCD nuclease subunit
MRFLHTADLHLDAAMDSGLPPEKARERRSELLLAFAEMIRFAKENGVDAVLLAGDLFDTAQISARTRQFVADTVASSPELEFYYVRGNHDRSDLFSCFEGALPANLHRFGSQEWTSYRQGDVVITGRDLDGSCADPAAELALREEDFNIVLLHGQISEGRKPQPEQILLKSYRGRCVDYLALGHIHSFRCESLGSRSRERGIWCYPGCPAGRGFDECGQKGFVLLDTEKTPLSPQFVPLAGRVLWDPAVDCTDLTGTADLEERVLRAVEGISERDLLKVRLSGAIAPEIVPDRAYLTRLLQSRFYFAKVVDETTLLLRPQDYRDDVSLKGEFIRLVLADKKLSDEERERIIACGLRTLAGEDPLP